MARGIDCQGRRPVAGRERGSRDGGQLARRAHGVDGNFTRAGVGGIEEAARGISITRATGRLPAANGELEIGDKVPLVASTV
jgi:hypothetical protein